MMPIKEKYLLRQRRLGGKMKYLARKMHIYGNINRTRKLSLGRVVIIKRWNVCNVLFMPPKLNILCPNFWLS